jgi:RNA polymerase sigma-70 factor (ECF subfamily)
VKVDKAHDGNSTSSFREAFADLYDEYMPKVYRYVSYRVNDVAVAEDLTSMIFEKALTKFHDYRADKGAVSTWLFTIARNTVIDHYRTEGRKKTVPLDSLIDTYGSDPPAGEELDRQRKRLRLKECLSRLSPKAREIISLKFGTELKNRQIAVALKISETNIGTILYRAVQQLRNCFQEVYGG